MSLHTVCNMAGGITLEQAQAQLASALEALTAARQAQSYQVGSQTGARRVDRAEFAALQADVKYWEQKVASISRGGQIRTMYGVCLVANPIAAVQANVIDKLVTYLNPEAGQRRHRARTMLALSGAYVGARYDRRQTRNWFASRGSADADTLADIVTLRPRSGI